MSASPKIVKIDLDKQSKKYRTSPSKKSPKKYNTQTHQFSFSEDHDPISFPHKSPPKPIIPRPLAKKLFPSPPKATVTQQSHKKSSANQKHFVDKIREKYRKMNPNYEKIDETDCFFKKSIEKLKDSFFKHDKHSIQTTKQVLKQIGKYAANRSKSKPAKNISISPTESEKKKIIPFELHGFKESPNVGKTDKTRKEREQLKGTYLNFQQSYELSIQENNKLIKNLDYRSSSVHYMSPDEKQMRKKEPFLVDHEDFAPTEKDPIGQREIDVVCQIFQYCNKCREDDRISIKDLNELIQQFQRIYLLQTTQGSQQTTKKLEPIHEGRFYNILQDLQEDLKVIFYRKKQHNIYDALYYLKQTNHLELVCQDFLRIKNILSLQ